MSDNRRTTLDAAATATADIVKPDVNARSQTPLSALLYADNGTPIASTNIRYFPDAELTQGTVKRQRDRVAEVVDPGLRKGIKKGVSRMGFEVTDWQGTEVRDIHGLTALVTRYQRADTQTGSPFQVRLIRVYAASRTFFLTFSYRLAEWILMEPIAERVTRSVRLNRN
ncbi:hypothetical protein CKO28_00230 [Rhodovibrio sodomensis]|uniref:Uncharacterized protein n=2 Tax=Rhodovibrio sodomensis TaxID=1088 RepID=A0ABS1D7S8_9PROT|nr:hypothetical protein [Rhodovibrio sodomensis]